VRLAESEVTRIETYRQFFLEVEHFWHGCVVYYYGWEIRGGASDSASWAVPGTLDND
jgi:hypothetical protein